MAGASEGELTEKDLAKVLREIHESQKHAYYVGLELDLPSEKLDNIKTRSADDLEQLLLVIKEFLKRIEPRATWSAIANALRSPLVGMTELAEKIEHKYCPPPKQELETVSMATDQLSPEMGSSGPQVERLSLNDGELSEPVRGKQKSTTTGLDHPQRMVQEPTSKSRSGKQTNEYTRVRQSLDAITQVIDMNPGANQRLRQKFQKERWLSLGSDTGGEQLVTVALSRIENDAGQFQQFIDMLNDIDGMDLIVKKLTVDEEENSCGMKTTKRMKLNHASSASPHTPPLPVAVSEARPTIRQLYTLKSRRGRTLHVIKSAAPSWRRLAHALNLSTSAVDSIEISSFYQIERACETSLCRWISEAPAGQPVCWATLLQALRDADLNSLATDLQLVLMENAE